MTEHFELLPLEGAGFGARVELAEENGAAALADLAESHPSALPGALNRAEGLLVLRGMHAINNDPGLLVRLSRVFGTEVENYRETQSAREMIHPSVDEILVISNLPPATRQPPARPDPPLTAGGELPTQFPHRRGWHTDQSYRRPPPDVSLFYAVIPAPPGQGQTLYASGTLAYESLPEPLRRRAHDLVGIHAQPGIGYGEIAVKNGETPKTLEPHQRPQRQPVVRIHPVTGEPALYLCEAGQMDWIEGPFVGMEPGPEGDGARLLYELMAHFTQPQFTYVHDWSAGDLVIYDNRNLIHAATWFDAERHQRLMWRTTVRGNPGAEYAGEARSWIP